MFFLFVVYGYIFRFLKSVFIVLSGSVEVNKKQSWAASPSTVFYHFGASGLSVAVATAVTHPLGF